MPPPAAAQPPITAPGDLERPLLDQFRDVLTQLTPDGAKAFARDVVESLLEAQGRNNLRPVQEVVEAWYRTLVVIDRVGAEEVSRLLGESATRTEPGKSLDEVRSALGV